jgi:hypothetical protein
MGTKQVIKNYMTGLVIEMIIISGQQHNFIPVNWD